MGLTYEVDASAGIVLQRWLGPVGANDVAELWAAIANDAEAMACRGSMADVTECTLRFTGTALRNLVRDIADPALRGRGWKVAVLVQEPVQYGMARQFEVIAERLVETMIFTDAAAAREWILSGPPPAPAA